MCTPRGDLSRLSACAGRRGGLHRDRCGECCASGTSLQLIENEAGHHTFSLMPQVSTSDGRLLCRHDLTLDDSTDVAEHPEFATRRCSRQGVTC